MTVKHTGGSATTTIKAIDETIQLSGPALQASTSGPMIELCKWGDRLGVRYDRPGAVISDVNHDELDVMGSFEFGAGRASVAPPRGQLRECVPHLFKRNWNPSHEPGHVYILEPST